MAQERVHSVGWRGNSNVAADPRDSFRSATPEQEFAAAILADAVECIRRSPRSPSVAWASGAVATYTIDAVAAALGTTSHELRAWIAAKTGRVL